MDFIMPVMDGPEATRLLRDAGFKGLIVGITGNMREEEVEHFKSCGADVVMGKPLDIEYLAQLLKNSTKTTDDDDVDVVSEQILSQNPTETDEKVKSHK
jgi:CheY-like chemotaxis protein